MRRVLLAGLVVAGSVVALVTLLPSGPDPRPGDRVSREQDGPDTGAPPPAPTPRVNPPRLAGVVRLEATSEPVPGVDVEARLPDAAPFRGTTDASGTTLNESGLPTCLFCSASSSRLASPTAVSRLASAPLGPTCGTTMIPGCDRGNIDSASPGMVSAAPANWSDSTASTSATGSMASG